MWIEQLRVSQLRVIEQAELRLRPGLNVFTGPNGAGKTSVLEAAHLLSFGRSFRAGGREVLVRRGAASVSVFATVLGRTGETSRIGLERQSNQWQGRINGQGVSQLSELYRHCPVLAFDPGSHLLISGGSELRRAALDWIVFHVEPDFLELWRRYQRALKQRNALLKAAAPDAWFEPWETELALTGDAISDLRARQAAALEPPLQEICGLLLPELGACHFQFEEGWRNDSSGLGTADHRAKLADARAGDRERGFTRYGPHRCDWSLTYATVPVREHLSRGQEKLTALAMIFAQLLSFHHRRGEWPILLLDDLCSELDPQHLGSALRWLAGTGAQLLISSVAWPDTPGTLSANLFHVEQGSIRQQD